MKKIVAAVFGLISIVVSPVVSYGEVEKGKVLVELFLAAEQKEEFHKIKKAYADIGVSRVKAQFYPKGRAPQIIGFGREVPADVARLTLQIARQYTGEIEFILPDFLLPTGFITIGSSHFSEENHVPVSPEDARILLDPGLDTETFYLHYRSFITRTARFGPKSADSK
jgi:hypothetical protein